MQENEQNETQQGAPQVEAYPLDKLSADMIAELRQQAQQQLRDTRVAENAILSRFLREHKLEGNWRLAENASELIKVAEQPGAQRAL